MNTGCAENGESEGPATSTATEAASHVCVLIKVGGRVMGARCLSDLATGEDEGEERDEWERERRWDERNGDDINITVVRERRRRGGRGGRDGVVWGGSEERPGTRSWCYQY